MPSTYAHYRFGQEVFSQLSASLQQVILQEKALFDLGLHGPDLLFYYHPLRPNPTNQVGYELHSQPGLAFFRQAGLVLRKSRYQVASLVYLYGVICHFVLDRACHAYVDEKIVSSGCSHTEIEVEFDRSLLVRDGFDPVTKCLTEHIHPTPRAARIVSRFYAGVSPEKAFHAIRAMQFYNALLVAPGKRKRRAIYRLLRLTGNEKEMQGLVVNLKPDPRCADSNRILLELYRQAVPAAAALMEAFLETVQGKHPWDPLYRYTFGGKDTGNGSGEGSTV